MDKDNDLDIPDTTEQAAVESGDAAEAVAPAPASPEPTQASPAEEPLVVDTKEPEEGVKMGSFSFKKLNGDGCTVECDLSKTVSELKDAVAESEGVDKSLLKLISKGKILKDDDPVIDVHDPTGQNTLVLFVSKAKKKPAAPAAAPAPAPAAAPAPAPAAAPASASTPAASATGGTDVTTSPTPAAVDASAGGTGDAPAAPTPEQQMASNPLAQALPLLMAWLLQAADNTDAMNMLLQNEEVRTQLVNSVQLRRALLELPAVRQQLLRANPQIATIATSQADSFNSLVNSPAFMRVGVSSLQAAANASGLGGMMGMGGAGDDGSTADEDVVNTQMMSSVGLTESQQAEVQEIVGMGFAQAEVIQIYVACDKNKEMTINFLLNGGMS